MCVLRTSLPNGIRKTRLCRPRIILVGSPLALLPQALTRTHGGPAKPYNTLHLLRRWCALAGSRRATVPAGMSAAGTCARAQDPVSAATVGCRKTAGAPLFPAAYFLPCTPGDGGLCLLAQGPQIEIPGGASLDGLEPQLLLGVLHRLALEAPLGEQGEGLVGGHLLLLGGQLRK